MDETKKEIMRLRKIVRELDDRLNAGRDYLLTADDEDISAADALEALGFERDGTENY